MRKETLILAITASAALTGAPKATPARPPTSEVGPPPISTVGRGDEGTRRTQDDDSPPPPVRAQARANAASYVEDGDYPASAMSANQQGQVTFRLRIGPNGRVTDCEVIVSSGSPALDQATCRIMRSRARFTPARDAQGNPVEDVQTNSIGWHLP